MCMDCNECGRGWEMLALTYLLTPWSRVLEKLTSKLCSLVKKFPAFMEPESPSPYPQVPAICPPWANSIQSPRPPPTSWRSILNYPPIYVLWSPQWPLSLRLPHQHPVHASLLPHTRHMPCPSHSSRFYHPQKCFPKGPKFVCHTNGLDEASCAFYFDLFIKYK
jgi:hypothetical protein